MLLNLTFLWGVIMTILKLTSVVSCSWWIIWLPLPIGLVLGVLVMMYLSMLFSGSVKFWKSLI